MLVEFVNRLPYKLRRQISQEYESKKRELNYILEKRKDEYKWIDDSEFLEYLLLLAIFYRQVIDPISGTIKFAYRVNKLGAENIKIGRTELSKYNMKKLYRMVTDFYDIVEKFGLSPYLFDFYDVKDFLKNIEELSEEV